MAAIVSAIAIVVAVAIVITIAAIVVTVPVMLRGGDGRQGEQTDAKADGQARAIIAMAITAVVMTVTAPAASVTAPGIGNRRTGSQKSKGNDGSVHALHCNNLQLI